MRFRSTAGMYLMLASCLLRPFTLPAASLSTPEVDVPDVMVVWPGAKIHLTAAHQSDVVEVAIGGGMMRAVSGVIEAPMRSGDYWLSVASRDAAGNVSEVSWSLLRVDGDAPSLRLKLEPEPVSDDTGKEWLPPKSRALAEAADAISGVGSVSVGVGDTVETVQGASEASLSLPAEGSSAPATVWAEAEDVVGNITLRLDRQVFVDATPPIGEIVVEGPHANTSNGLVLGPAARLRAIVSDHESGGVEWTAILDGEEVQASRWDGPWSEGASDARARITDRVGNETLLEPMAFRVDQTAPKVAWRVHGTRSFTKDGTEFHASPVRVEVEASDGVAGVSHIEWSSDGEIFFPLDGDVVSDGDAIVIRATDRVDNVADERAVWNVDNAPPVLEIETPDGTRFEPGETVRIEVGGEFRVRASDEGSGVARVSWDEARTAVRRDETFRFLTASERAFRVTAEDNLGHVGDAEWHLIVERKAR